VGIEDGDAVQVIDTATDQVVAIWRGEVACASTQGGTALLSGAYVLARNARRTRTWPAAPSGRQ
jgi:hypothetical protein